MKGGRPAGSLLKFGSMFSCTLHESLCTISLWLFFINQNCDKKQSSTKYQPYIFFNIPVCTFDALFWVLRVVKMYVTNQPTRALSFGIQWEGTATKNKYATKFSQTETSMHLRCRTHTHTHTTTIVHVNFLTLASASLAFLGRMDHSIYTHKYIIYTVPYV